MIDPNTHEPTLNPGNSKPSELPSALRKQTQSYTLHLISRFLSYKTLFFGFHAFTTNFKHNKNTKKYP